MTNKDWAVATLLCLGVLGVCFYADRVTVRIAYADERADYIAFGQRSIFPHNVQGVEQGIKMRDYIAIQAMNGLVARYGQPDERMAVQAYQIADMMIKAR